MERCSRRRTIQDPAPAAQADDPYASGTPVIYQGAQDFTLEGNLDDKIQFGLETLVDGTSNTLMASEIIQGIGGPGWDLRGLVFWGYGAGFSTIILPNADLPDRLQSHQLFH